MASNLAQGQWRFWIDRGGTFTDIVAQGPDGQIRLHKLLSENPERYSDAPIQGIRELMDLGKEAALPGEAIAEIRMGTTVATNALLERKGDPTLLLITEGFRDALRIGYQNRPDIFARQILLPEMLYERVIEVRERHSAQGEVLVALSEAEGDRLGQALQQAYDEGFRACAIAFLHGYRYPAHEQAIAAIARQVGFTQVSTSHEVSPLIKLVGRGDTTVVDAYLSPILRRYVDRVVGQVGQTRLLFMQSNGGLTDAHFFQGKDSILSGPAGGIVGAVQSSLAADFDKIITFDMGGTSTDVAHYSGEYERTFEAEVAGVRMRVPMMAIHTVAAGGGSVLFFDGARYRVGPESAGANPGPACYRRGGPLAVTDCNVMLGKIQPDFFPQVFGPEGNLPIDGEVVRQRFSDLAAEIRQATGDGRSPEEVAQGFLAIAVDNMANAIQKISTQRGYDVSEYTLCCFGAAGGQHACLIAEALGMERVFVHPYAGVLSAYGMGLADVRSLREQSIEAELTAELLPQLTEQLAALGQAAQTELIAQGVPETREIRLEQRVHLRYVGTDSSLVVAFGDLATMRERFEQAHQQRYGFFTPEKALVVAAIAVEAIAPTQAPAPASLPATAKPPVPLRSVAMYSRAAWHETPVYARSSLGAGDRLVGPAIIVEATGTTVLEVGWEAAVTGRGELLLTRSRVAGQPASDARTTDLTKADPVLLEIFNNLFMAIAEQMGVTLQNTSYSVNIKERLDFSCAIFDRWGQLVANAPHIPVHLGSMGESVQTLIAQVGEALQPGDVYVLNNPYNGGTHLPDVTVITPVFATETRSDRPEILFYVASRGHHADIGGITPGSMPPTSTSIHDEGILIDCFQLVDRGEFQEAAITELLTSGPYPARNPVQNIADLKAQIAANEKGVQELHRMVEHFSLPVVAAYMQHVQDNAEAAVRRAIAALARTQGHQRRTFVHPLDNGSQIQVAVTLDGDRQTAQVDFSGTSAQQPSNFNAPVSVCKAAVLYVFRTLVDDNIPLNAGCLKPIEIRIPEGCLLHPQAPAAVVAGNVEVSQAVTDALYSALGVLASSQGTMNNFTFGNDRYAYYETICGGSGAGATFDGTDAVHTHMTNSRLTDPEVLEWRFPVLVDRFEIRAGSGGPGQHRGGHGVVRRIRFREAMTAAILSSHRAIGPNGLQGGHPGTPGRNWIQRADGAEESLGGTAIAQLQPGDLFIIETPGGGGFGAPEA
ncbi:hydantoinase B/oxoprolinase family protein [Geitlerinema sp. PCC 7407]|uniref:hydantoinase B/oxoprolinase family protein n=1 Tax=Geitlerinema sp. PCC 7407 TaxID=1173025 RepID=UPI00029FD049|nr:hydantoinase B/oxoprolinase family protein [Geitlerinema sp. PCC 7407]AFY65699.1 5-oxoprolinase (ATP-hydrolysing) [Geitlerinema sp. PCC 7407]